MPSFGASACRAAALLVLCVPLCACQRGNEQLDEAAMARQLRTLSSLSSEGAVLASELRAGHVTPSFASVHIEDLLDDANKARSEIANPAPLQLEPRQRQAQALTEQLLLAFRAMALVQHGSDAQLAQREQAFRRLQSAFDALKGAR